MWRTLSGVRAVTAMRWIGAWLCLLVATAANAAGATLRADGSQFQLITADGLRLHSQDLVGAELQTSDGEWIRIDAVQLAADPNGRPLWLHRLSARDGHGPWRDACTPHSDGTRHALVVPGRQQPDGTVAEDDKSFAISCTSGALAKCLRSGYRPWEPNQRALYNACIHMVRGAYGGDGQPYTENGRLIDIYDPQQIQRADMLPEQAFEAGWDEHGAVCVHHARVAANVSLAQLEERYPRLRGRVGEVCTEAFARAAGARIFNRSHHP